MCDFITIQFVCANVWREKRKKKQRKLLSNSYKYRVRFWYQFDCVYIFCTVVIEKNTKNNEKNARAHTYVRHKPESVRSEKKKKKKKQQKKLYILEWETDTNVYGIIWYVIIFQFRIDHIFLRERDTWIKRRKKNKTKQNRDSRERKKWKQNQKSNVFYVERAGEAGGVSI